MQKLINNYKSFRTAGEHNANTNGFNYLHYLYLRIRYEVGIGDYFDNKLWDKKTSHDDYYMNLHTYIHKWSNVKNKYMPNKSWVWYLVHYVDYMLSKLYCPGVDAMDYYRYNFYELNISKRRSYITEGGISKMNRILNGSPDAIKLAQKLANKAEFNRLFEEYINRNWVLCLDLTRNSFDSFCEGIEKAIVKPASGGGGKGIYIASISDKQEQDMLYNEVRGKNIILEEVINQDITLSALNPSSVNTIRVYTVCQDDMVYVTGATLRIGKGNGCTDNYSGGGLAAEIDTEKGVVVSEAVSQDGERYSVHPFSHKSILGFVIPCWNNVKDICKEAHKLVPDLGYIGWDVVVCNNKEITFLEANTCAGVELQQHPSQIGKKHIYDAFIKRKLQENG